MSAVLPPRNANYNFAVGRLEILTKSNCNCASYLLISFDLLILFYIKYFYIINNNYFIKNIKIYYFKFYY